jgi:hypothetical protein
MKNYYEVLKKYILDNFPRSSERMKELESVKNDQKELIKLYNDYKRLGNSRDKPIDESIKMTKSKFKNYIKEIITDTLNEANLYKITTDSGEKTMPFNSDKEANDAKKYGNVKDVEKLEELEPNSKQKLKLANKELAFLAKQVRSLEKQLKSQGSDENEG